jgi:type IV pilus assembly protein PilA
VPIGTLRKLTATQRLSAPQGFSLIELLIVVAIILAIAAIAVPNLVQSKMRANEASAVASLRLINSTSLAYLITYGNGFPPSLSALGPSGSTATCDAGDLLDPLLSSPPFQKSGYKLAYAGQDGTIASPPPGCSAPGYNGYLATATPSVRGLTGLNSYCSLEPGTFHVDPTGKAIASASACAALSPLQ